MIYTNTISTLGREAPALLDPEKGAERGRDSATQGDGRNEYSVRSAAAQSARNAAERSRRPQPAHLHEPSFKAHLPMFIEKRETSYTP